MKITCLLYRFPGDPARAKRFARDTQARVDGGEVIPVKNVGGAVIGRLNRVWSQGEYVYGGADVEEATK